MEPKKALQRVEGLEIRSEINGNHLYPVFQGEYVKTKAEKTKLYKVAIKAMHCLDIRGSFDNECRIFNLKPHKNIVKCIDTLKNVELAFGRFSKSKYNLLLLEYLPNNDLFEYVSKSGLGERVARFYFEQILDAIEYLHNEGFVHRDLKLENLLVDNEFNLQLTDFGYCVLHSDDTGPKVFKGSVSITTEDLMPPEHYEGQGYYGQQMDIFSLGKLLMSLVLGLFPFRKANKEDRLYSMILNDTWHLYWRKIELWMTNKKLESLSSNFKRLIERMLEPNPKLRITLKEIRESEWFLETKPSTLEEVKAIMLKIKKEN